MDELARMWRLKGVPRTGWAMRGVAAPESVADHCWGTAMLVLLFAPDNMDRHRALAMAAIHDLAEVETGDIPRGAMEESRKEARERTAMAQITRNREVVELWEEYAARTTREAQFVADMNLLDMCIQATVYEGEGRAASLEEFFHSSAPRFSTDRGRELFASLVTHRTSRQP